MYCNNCGSQIDCNYRFCGSCGAEIQRQEDLRCKHCGEPISQDAKYCNACGGIVQEPDKPEIKYCKYCGLIYEENDGYCKQCGQMKENNLSFPAVAEKFKEVGQTLFKFKKASPNTDFSYNKSLGIRYMVLAGLFALVLVFWFIPVIQVEIPIMSLFSSDMERICVSIGNPFANESLSKLLLAGMSDSEYQSAKSLLTISTIFTNVIPLLLCIVFSLLPLKNNLTKRRRLIFHKLVALNSTITPITHLIVYKDTVSQIKESYGENMASVSWNFGGWLMLFLCIGVTIYTFMLSAKTKQINVHR